MTVRKFDNAEVYAIYADGESATIVLREWSEPSEAAGGKIMHRGQLLIQSERGNWAHYWNACGVPFKQFLVRLSFDYFMGKMLGRDLQEHDGPGTLKALQRRVLAKRRRKSIAKNTADFLWCEIGERIESMEHDLRGYCEGCSIILREAGQSWNRGRVSTYDDRELSELLEEPWCDAVTRDNPQAVGFWQHIWPEFAATLRSEIEQTAASPAAQPAA